MSLIVFMETEKGLLLAGDSRISIDKDPFWHKDTAYKILDFYGKYGIAFVGDGEIEGELMHTVVCDFISMSDSTLSIEEFSNNLKNFISFMGHPKTCFYILGYEDGKRKIFIIDMINNIYEDISSTICGCNGEDDIAWDLLSNNYEQHKLFDDAIKYIPEIFNKTSETILSVGGEIDILLIKKSGSVEWIKRKNLT